MRVLIIVDHFPLSPRVNKMKKIYQDKGYETRVLAWGRDVEERIYYEKDVDVLRQSLGYGNRIKKLLNLTNMKKSIYSSIKLYNPDIVHAIDFEMAFLVSRLQAKFNFSFKFIYEVYDIKFFKNTFINNVRLWLEQKILLNLDLIIFASPFFPEYYTKNFRIFPKTKKIIINNKPSLNQLEFSESFSEYNQQIERKKMKIGFIGTVRYFDILKNLIIASEKNENLQVEIYGDGPDLEKIRSIAHSNVNIHGRFEVKDLLDIYGQIDYIWACYPSDDENVKYAVSNKYFESLFFSKPILVSKNTHLGDLVEKENTGLAIDATSIKDVESILENLNCYEFNMPTAFNPLYTWENEEKELSMLLEVIVENKDKK